MDWLAPRARRILLICRGRIGLTRGISVTRSAALWPFFRAMASWKPSINSRTNKSSQDSPAAHFERHTALRYHCPMTPSRLSHHMTQIDAKLSDLTSEAGLEHHKCMRTTLSLDDDVFREVKAYAESRDVAIGKAVSELVRRGLHAPLQT